MLNKKRLAALGLSAVMVASTASLPVSAADFSDGSAVVSDESADFGVATTDVEVNDDAQTAVGATEIKEQWDYENKTVKYAFVDSEDPDDIHWSDTFDATKVVDRKANCFEDGAYHLTVAVKNDAFPEGHTFNSPSQPLKMSEADKAIHKQNYVAHEESVGGSCAGKGTPATVYKWVSCPICGVDGPKTESQGEIPTHVMGTVEKTVYELGDSTEFPDGDTTKPPVLNENSKKGFYYVIETGICKVCGEKFTAEKRKVDLSKEGLVETQKIVTKTYNIVGGTANDKLQGDFRGKDLPENNDIALIDCNTDGWYELTTTYDEGDPTTKRIAVRAHHTYGAFEVKAVNKDEQKYLTWTTDKDGKLEKVINTYCKKDIAYNVIVTCKSNKDHVISTTPGTAAKSTTNHSVNKELKNLATNGTKAQLAPNQMTQLKTGEENGYIKIVPDTATCEKAGLANIEFYCGICGEKVETIKGVKVLALGHKDVVTEENRVDATCEKSGSYDRVSKCERCHRVETKKVILPILDHTNISGEDTDKVDMSIKVTGNRLVYTGDVKVNKTFTGTDLKEDNGVYTLGSEDGGKIALGLYTNCTICKDHEALFKNVVPANLKVTVTSLTKPTYDLTGTELTKAGTIGLKITYTRADGTTVLTAERNVPYIDKTGVEIPDSLKNGLEQDADGEYRYYVNGQVDNTFRGIADYDGKKFLVDKGMLAKTAQGLHAVGDKFYFLANGQVQTQHTGLAMYDGASFYVVNGVMDNNKNGIVDYDGGKFAFAAGRLATEANGVWQDPTTGKWYFLAQGQVQTQHTGVAMYDGAFFYIQKGELAKDYKGTITYNGAKFNVVGGQLYGPIK